MSSSSTSSPSTPSTLPSNHHTLVVGVVLAIFAIFSICGILYWTYRRRQQASPENTWFPLSNNATLVDGRHLASRISPYGVRDGHEPGKDMRIAKRRSNGVWEFSNPEGSFSPSGIGDLDAQPAPRKPSKKSLTKNPLKLPRQGYLDVESLAYPPPAYTRHDT